MKYLKFFEDNNNNELEELIPEIDNLCQDLKDSGFKIKIENYNICFANFSKYKKRNIPHENKYKYIINNHIDGLRLQINKYNKEFNIDDIIGNLLFIESYAEDKITLDLKVNYYEYFWQNNWYCCEHAEYLPINFNMITIYVFFIKA